MRKPFRRRHVPGPLAVLGVVIGLIAMSATPASAATGAGEHSGTMTVVNAAVNPPPPFGSGPCAESELSYDNTGGAITDSGNGVITTGTHSYGPGPLSVTFHVPKVYQNPSGTHANFTCTSPSAWPVDSATVSGSYTDMFGTMFSVSCTWSLSNGGTYQRVGTAHTVNLPPGTNGPAGTPGTCTVSVSGWGSSTSPTRVVHEGSSVNCNNIGPPTSCEQAYAMTATDV